MSDKKQRINEARQQFYVAARAVIDQMERGEDVDLSGVNAAKAQYEQVRFAPDDFQCFICEQRFLIDEKKNYGVINASFIGAPGAPENNLLTVPQRFVCCAECFSALTITTKIKKGPSNG